MVEEFSEFDIKLLKLLKKVYIFYANFPFDEWIDSLEEEKKLCGYILTLGENVSFSYYIRQRKWIGEYNGYQYRQFTEKFFDDLEKVGLWN